MPYKINHILKSRLVFSATLLSLFFLIATAHHSSAEEIRQTQKALAVRGHAVITAVPTIAYVRIGVVTFNKDAVKSQSENAEKMGMVYKALARTGIAKDKIKTVSYSIYPKYDYKGNTALLTGYNVTNVISVTVTDLAKVGQVLDTAVEYGVNEANSLNFGITESENEKIYLQALAKAVADAKSKADTIADAAGIRLDAPGEITEEPPAQAGPLRYAVSDMMNMAKAERTPTAVLGGEINVEANVTVIYSYSLRR